MSSSFWIFLAYAAACIVLAVLLRYLLVIWILLRIFREPIDLNAPVCVELRDEDLHDGDRQFLQQHAGEMQALGLDHLTNAVHEEPRLRYLMTFWSVPHTRLVVLESMIIVKKKKVLAPMEHCEVYVRQGDQSPLNVTNSQMYLPDHSGTIKECGMHIRPSETGVPGLIAVAWALAADKGIDLSEPDPHSSVIDDLNSKRAQWNDRSLKSGKYVRSADGTVRWSLKERLRMLAFVTPGIPSATAAARKRRFRREFESIRHLLPEDYDSPEVIPLVQYRVRTGSTAPLTQP